MVVGTAILKPADLPTASLVFNVSTLGGATLGVGIVSGFVAERQKLYASALTEPVPLDHAFDADRITTLAGAVAGRVTDDAGATALIASVAQREAWVLAFNDAWIVIAVALTLAIVAVLAIGRSRPLPRRPLPRPHGGTRGAPP
jgi:DHA2 family multidrug resistance protein